MSYEPIFDEFTASEDDQILFTRRFCQQCGSDDAGVEGICNRCWDASFNEDLQFYLLVRKEDN